MMPPLEILASGTSAPADLPGWLLAVGFGLSTLVQEDLPTITAALMAAAGRIPGWLGLLGCFLGIWVGDLLLYGAARIWGRPLLQRRWVRTRVSPAALERSEAWFARRGTGILLASRFLPGTRLPTYLAAGFLGVPFATFAIVTGLAVAVWTGGLFALARQFGPGLVGVLNQSHERIIRILTGGLFLLILQFLVRRLASSAVGQRSSRNVRIWLERWRHWEFWPAWLFYLPVGLHYLRLALRYGSLTLPSAANPGIFTGGLVGESKRATLRELEQTSPGFTAESWLIERGPAEQRITQLDRLIAEHRVTFPFILKPDIGQRGLGVKRIQERAGAIACLEKNPEPLVLQRYVAGPGEVGIFYIRYPHESRGRIYAITEKIFPEVLGDGRRSVEELVWADSRARLLASTYLRRLGHQRSRIPAAGESVRLVEAGNHAQGCIFRDGRRLHTPELETRIDQISQKLTGFYIGRYDLRFASEEELRAGRGFQILELNGAAAEATHIYDAGRSVVSAYRTLFEQWEHVFSIGAANRAQGAVPVPPRQLWQLWRDAQSRFAAYPLAD